MEETTNFSSGKRCAVVTGANKGIGLEICRQLASNGIKVISTARDEKRGVEAVGKLKASGLLDVVFHQLDVKDPDSIASLAKFVETNFGKLDILINNAAVNGVTIDIEALRAFKLGGGLVNDENAHLVNRVMQQSYEKAEACIRTNYYGTKSMTEAFLPLLQLSNSARIVNVSSIYGQLQFIYNDMVKAELENLESLTEEKIDQLLLMFLKDFEEDKLQANGWPLTVSAYKVSKAVINAYTRLVAKKFPNILVNCVHPGLVKTDISSNYGNLSPEEGARAPVMLALLPDDGPSGLYFYEMHVFLTVINI
ncbi:unnamed protein product [Ilex paraguariensis]|uniref:Short-chain dehydrogenase/reductase n=1 Tax=Ilex paraguariensis TaxID=185542 RepID=A0ABC8SSX3_9AQUA